MESLSAELSWLQPYIDIGAGSSQHWGGVGQFWVRIGDSTETSGTKRLRPSQPVDLPVMVLRSIGKGGMGAAILVYDPRPGYEGLRVCKVVQPAAQTSRFQEEVRLLAGVNHENVVRFRAPAKIILPNDVGTSSPTTFLHAFLMDFIPGGSLLDLLRMPTSSGASRTKRVPVREALRVTGQVVAGLRALHDVGIIHRDIKPGNILLDISSGRTARLCDLGVAKEVDLAGSGDPSSQAGTFGYMAPEILDLKPAEPAADFFSAGCVLVEMLVGQPTFARTPMSTYSDPPKGLDKIGKLYGSTTRTLAADLLIKDSRKRLCDPDRIQKRIETILGSDVKTSTKWWVADWPQFDRNARELNEFVAEEKSWFQSGKTLWAGCLIGLHVRRRTLSEFSDLLLDLSNRLYVLGEPLSGVTDTTDATIESIRLTNNEFERSVIQIVAWFDVRFSETLKQSLGFVSDDRHERGKFLAIVDCLRLGSMPFNPPPESTLSPPPQALKDLVQVARQRRETVRKCWRLCLRFHSRMHGLIADCSDQLVAIVAKFK